MSYVGEDLVVQLTGTIFGRRETIHRITMWNVTNAIAQMAHQTPFNIHINSIHFIYVTIHFIRTIGKPVTESMHCHWIIRDADIQRWTSMQVLQIFNGHFENISLFQLCVTSRLWNRINQKEKKKKRERFQWIYLKKKTDVDY